MSRTGARESTTARSQALWDDGTLTDEEFCECVVDEFERLANSKVSLDEAFCAVAAILLNTKERSEDDEGLARLVDMIGVTSERRRVALRGAHA